MLNMTETDSIGFFSKPSENGVVSELPGSDEKADYYNMNHSRRGTAVIFNHFKFDDDRLTKRSGTFKDEDDLKSVLKSLQFDVTIYKDLKFGAIHDVISNLSKADHSNADCLLVAVLTHGDRGKIYARDHQYPPDLIWKAFDGNKSPTLAGKPKLFFIQACRGDEVDDGTRVRAVMETDSRKVNSYTIPVMADILVMFSCYDGYYSWRCPQRGSWFIQSLCNELKLRAKEIDLLTILTFVNRKMAISYQSIVPSNENMHNKKQIGTIVSTLTRLLYFYPVATDDLKPSS